jgi:putative SOS response-associated peptidase YedK
MCNLYSLTKPRNQIAVHFRVPDNRTLQLDLPLPTIFPAYTAPVIRLADDGEREIVTMSWGFVLLQDGRAARRVTNVRDDKVLTSKFWRPSFEARRCLVPASSYCEPNGDTPASQQDAVHTWDVAPASGARK